MSRHRRSKHRFAIALALALASGAVADVAIELREYCPPGFELTSGNRCELRTLYDNYDSLRDAGVGGPRTALPPARDGFSPQQIDLGRYLFFDPLLSGEGSLSCASCHHPELGFSDGRPRSVGNEELRRSAPSLWNVAFQKRLFWDARAASLEEQMTGPLYDPAEMGSDPFSLVGKLRDNATYRRLFREAFPGSDDSPTLQQVYLAIAAFQSSLISLNSRYDQYAHGFHEALSEDEIDGMNVFRSFVARCAECHTPPLFTNQQIAVIGVRDPEGVPFDEGAQAVTGNAGLRGGFKVPSLRNVTQTGPYMHSGAFDTLRDAVRFYTLGRGHALPEEERARMTIHWHIWEPGLTDEELDLLVAFLATLTDERFKPAIPPAVPSGLTPVGRVPDGLAQQLSQAD
jgi:cytochrome c peroxidase